MTLKPTEMKTQWLKNQPKQNISEKNEPASVKFPFQTPLLVCNYNPDHPELAPHCAN